MFVCVASFSQPSSKYLQYVKCFCVLSRYPSPVLDICYMLNVCVCVVSLPQPSSRDLFYVRRVCGVSLSQPSNRDLLYVCVLSR